MAEVLKGFAGTGNQKVIETEDRHLAVAPGIAYH